MSPPPLFSIVIPVFNEAENIEPMVREIQAAFRGRTEPYEVIFVDDASNDDSPAVLQRLTLETAGVVRSLHHRRNFGQSAAVGSGFRAARGEWIGTLDGDGQNDPAYIPALIAALQSAGPSAGIAAGQRLGRKDTGFKKMQSRIANAVRGRVLKDGTRDTGCGLKAFRRDVYLALPYFDALHRFMPALVRREGLEVVLVDVVDRPRLTGVSNYGFFDRLWVGILDLAGVWWLIRRRRSVPQVREIA